MTASGALPRPRHLWQRNFATMPHKMGVPRQGTDAT